MNSGCLLLSISPPCCICFSLIFTEALLPHLLQWTHTGAFRYELELTPVSISLRRNKSSAFLNESEYALKLEIKFDLLYPDVVTPNAELSAIHEVICFLQYSKIVLFGIGIVDAICHLSDLLIGNLSSSIPDLCLTLGSCAIRIQVSSRKSLSTTRNKLIIFFSRD